MRYRWKLLLPVAAALVAVGCTGPRPQPAAGGERAETKVKVVASFYPLYDLARQIAGERAEVVSLIPNGAEPHEWEPRAAEVRALNSAQVFVYNGAGFEPWVEKVLAALDTRSLVAVDASQGMELLRATEPEEHGDHREQGGTDPHIWLDPVHNQQQVQLIVAALVRADPAGEAIYTANATALAERLQALDREYQALAGCPRREIVISHGFFGYPARRYGLRQRPIIAGIAPDAEPTPGQMAALVRFVREQGIRHIFFETLVSDRVARVIAGETGAQTLALNPIEGLTADEEAQGKDFLALMRENLANLKIALECSP